MDVQMLDDVEYARAAELYKAAFSLKGSREQRYELLLDYYKEITGFEETEPNAIMHHRISQYGPPCEVCGKPYRTPLASFCAACGNRRP
jgi:hypothetical protein